MSLSTIPPPQINFPATDLLSSDPWRRVFSPCISRVNSRRLDGQIESSYKRRKERYSISLQVSPPSAKGRCSRIAKLQIIDPDVILGHNFESVDYGILLHRMKDCSSSHWSKFGRMRRSEWPKGFGRGGTSWGERQIVAGRLICDLSNDMGRVCIPLTTDLTM
jgi:DNA polymerase alpha subunit A